MPALELFNVGPSFYSQVARLALAEKGLAWRDVITAPGPPTFDSYAPWYVALHAEMTVPALRHGEVVVGGSLAIARYVDALPGPPLLPPDAAEVERWLSAFEGVSVRELSYGSMSGETPAKMNALRLRVLRKRRDKHPELRDAYEAKIADIEGFQANASDPAKVAAQRERLDAHLDALDGLLAERDFVAGAQYSLADVAWTVTLARLYMLEIDPLVGRARLGDWYARMKARPSFRSADIWERMRPGKLLLTMARRYWVTLAGAGLTLALAGGLLIWAAA